MDTDRITRRQLLIGAGTLFLARSAGAAPGESPGRGVEIWRAEWRDAGRNRVVPVKVYFPRGDGPFPVVVFSHGLGGSRENYEYLGNHWAAHDFVSVHVQHIGSDDSLWRGGAGERGVRGGMTLKAVLDRPRDVSFALDQLQTLNKTGEGPLRGRLDLSKVGMAGHSFGANTTLLIAGMKLPGITPSVSDKRVRCAIALSSPPPISRNYDALYNAIRVPILHMTGTKDSTQFDLPGATPADRRTPYDHIPAADGYLVTFAGGDHMLFAGQRVGNRVAPSDARNHLLIQQSTTAFWNAYLRGDAKALAWLRNDFAKELGGSGVFEQKQGKKDA